MRGNSRERMLQHLTNVEMTMQQKAEELESAASMILEIYNRIADGERLSPSLRDEVRDIWTSVMESEYDPEY